MEIPAFCSQYYPMFVELGHPELDIRVFDDGEWAILEMYNAPIIPALVKWKYVLTGLRNLPITRTFVEKYLKQIDPRSSEFWALQDAKSQEADANADAIERKQAELSERAYEVIRGNESLCERLAQNGERELNMDRLALAAGPKKLGYGNHVSYFPVSHGQDVPKNDDRVVPGPEDPA